MSEEVEILVGVNVVDPAGYTEYRARMSPLLATYGGSFQLDVQVADVLRSPGDQPFNRLFTIRFPSDERRQAFFSDPAYLEVRRHLFEPSVSAATQFAKYPVTP